MRNPRSQQGVVLLVGLIMLIMMTLMAVAAFTFGKSNFLVVSNQQTREEATRSAEQVLEQIVNNPSIPISSTANLFGTGNVIDVDVNGDGNNDYRVTVAAPACVQSARIPNEVINNEMNALKPAIAAGTLNFGSTAVKDVTDCLASGGAAAASGGLTAPGASLESNCTDVVFDIRATAEDAFRLNRVTVVQGVAQRQVFTKADAACI
jgi:Tfp pilus assembly protein PilX